MAEATLAGFRAQFPELDADKHDDAAVERDLELAKTLHSVSALATLYLTAHLLEVDQDDSGEVMAVRAGGLSLQVKTQAGRNQEAFYTRTEYGRRFLALEKRTPRSVIGASVMRGRT